MKRLGIARPPQNDQPDETGTDDDDLTESLV
jgi:hypothetical protein